MALSTECKRTCSGGVILNGQQSSQPIFVVQARVFHQSQLRFRYRSLSPGILRRISSSSSNVEPHSRTLDRPLP